MPGDYLDYPFSGDTLLCELSQFAEKKRPVDERAVKEWCESVDVMFKDVHNQCKADGWTRYNPARLICLLESLTLANCLDVFVAWEPFVILSVTDGTSGGWLKRLFPLFASTEADTKANVYNLLKKAANGEGDIFKSEGKLVIFEFLSSLRFTWLQVKSGQFRSMIVHVFPKDEPVKEKKLKEGRHRSIQMPDWTYVVLERCLCAWVAADGAVCNHDFVYSKYGRFSEVAMGGWVFGNDVDRCLSGTKVCSSFDLDVSGWDKSLPFEVVLHIYVNTFFSDRDHDRFFCRLAETFAKGYNGFGVFLTNEGAFRLPDGSTAWSSGCLNTLCGNSMAHSALLMSRRVDHLVMGDDANACIKWKVKRPKDEFALKNNCILSEDELVELYRKVGLLLKKVESVRGLSFCKRRVSTKGRLSIDWDDVVAKSNAKQAGPVEGRIRLLYPVFRHYFNEFNISPPSSIGDAWKAVIEID